MSLDFAPTYVSSPSVARTRGNQTDQAGRIVGNVKATAHPTPDAEFDHISRKLTAGPLTLEYLVAYSIEAFSKR